MDPYLCRTISYAILFVGTALVLTGSMAAWYFGNRIEVIRPYQQPIRTATSTVEVTIESDQKVHTTYADRGGYIAFGKEDKPLLMMASTQCRARQTGDDEVVYRAVFNMDVTDSAVGKPLNFLKKAAKYVQIKFVPMPEKTKVLAGKAICTFNSEVRVEIPIPPQEIDKGLIFVRDMENAFIDFK